jgi:hypothetical protein
MYRGSGGVFIFRSSHSPVTDLMHIFILVHTVLIPR